MVHAVEADLFAFFPLLAGWRRAEAHHDPSYLWTISDLPFPLFNSVVNARLGAGNADARIEERIAACERRGVPMLWWTGPASTPRDLDDRLERRGFLVDGSRGMAADLDAMQETGPADPSVTINRVLDRKTLASWCRVLCSSFSAPEAFGDAFAEFAVAIGLGDDSPFRHFLASVNGVPAATCSVFLGAGVAGIYDVATLPERRRRGIGRLITQAAMSEARRCGFRMAILHSSMLGVNVYESLGFHDLCRIGQYIWVPERLKT